MSIHCLLMVNILDKFIEIEEIKLDRENLKYPLKNIKTLDLKEFKKLQKRN